MKHIRIILCLTLFLTAASAAARSSGKAMPAAAMNELPFAATS